MSSITDEEFAEMRTILAERRAAKEERERPGDTRLIQEMTAAGGRARDSGMVRVRDGALVFQPGAGGLSAGLYQAHENTPETAFINNQSLKGQAVPMHIDASELFGMVRDLRSEMDRLRGELKNQTDTNVRLMRKLQAAQEEPK